MNKDEFCSLASTDLSMAGTADPVDVWLMLEYPMSWKAKVLEDNQLAEITRQWLADSIGSLQAQGLKVRPQFIRQPEYERDSLRLIVATADLCWQLEGQGYGVLHDVQLDDFLSSVPPGGERLEQPLYFVCMNGQRDRCCARFGRPIYNALREQFGDRVWQVSHLGGHRFAPNILTLPQGGVYGRVTDANLQAFADAVERDELHFESLRGLGWHNKAVQAAQVFSARQGLVPVSAEETASGHTKVVFSVSEGESISITVGQSSSPVLALASCKDDQPKPVHPYQLIE